MNIYPANQSPDELSQQAEFDTQMRRWSEDELIAAVREVAVRARGEKESAFVLSSAYVETRDAMRKELMTQLGSYWRDVETSQNMETQKLTPSVTWWQIRLPNSSIIRISSEPHE